jgi:phosphoglycolate phosphatase-like HAD superfamily hydrolase
MTKYFNGIYGSPSSKYDNLILALSNSEVSYKDVVFFGDAKSDLQVADTLQIDFVGVGKKMHDLLISLDAQYYFINDFLNLVDESIN